MSLTRRPWQTRSSTPPTSVPRTIPAWLATLVVAGAVLVTGGAVVAIADPAILLGPDDHVTRAVRIYADYLVSRNLPLGVMLVAMLVLRARRVLAALMVLTAAIQILDIVMDGVTGRWVLIPGLLVFAAVFIFGAHRLADQPLWHSAAWRDAA